MQRLYSNGPISRFGTQYALDAIAWVLAIVLAAIFRWDFDFDSISWRPLAILCLVAAIMQLPAGWLLYLYRGRHPYGSFAELRALLFAVILVAIIVGSQLPYGGRHGASRGVPSSLRSRLRSS